MSDIIRQETFSSADIKLTSPAEIKTIVKNFKNGKAPGWDDIPNIVLKNLNNKALVQLTHIFNCSLKLSYFPNAWKTAIILPIYKGGGKDKKEPTSYRPISLLCTISKIFEKIILTRLNREGKLETEVLNDDQFGFRESRSTVKQLARVVFDITNNFNLKKSTAALLLDVEKAFDTVWHDGLIYQLKEYNIPIYIIRIISSFLSSRKFKVKVGNDLSTSKTQAAGVPQGSILGPKLYIIYNNNIPANKETKKALFADDTQ